MPLKKQMIKPIKQKIKLTKTTREPSKESQRSKKSVNVKNSNNVTKQQVKNVFTEVKSTRN
tara:strand:+ start:93 stop:275 length:183 start_codon:yes stop_codon:yes gene_type:complete